MVRCNSYLDGSKDATQIVEQGPNDKHYKPVQLEKQYTIVGELRSYYLSHFSPENGKGRAIAQNLFMVIRFMVQN